MSGGSAAAWTSRTGKGRMVEELTEVRVLDAMGDNDLDGDEDEDSIRAADAVSRAFVAHHVRLLRRLGGIVEESEVDGSSSDVKTVQLAPKDLASLELGPLSTMDARWVEWLAETHPGVAPSIGGAPSSAESRTGSKVVVRVRRARWRDVLGAVFGFGLVGAD